MVSCIATFKEPATVPPQLFPSEGGMLQGYYLQQLLGIIPVLVAHRVFHDLDDLYLNFIHLVPAKRVAQEFALRLDLNHPSSQGDWASSPP